MSPHIALIFLAAGVAALVIGICLLIFIHSRLRMIGAAFLLIGVILTIVAQSSTGGVNPYQAPGGGL